jgi:hypothetical protein
MVLAALWLFAAQDPKRTPLEGSVVASKSSGRFRGRAFLEVTLRWFRLPRVTYRVAANAGTRAALLGGGPAAGAGIGAVAGGGAGPLIYTGTGAAAGAARLPVQTPILFPYDRLSGSSGLDGRLRVVAGTPQE